MPQNHMLQALDAFEAAEATASSSSSSASPSQQQPESDRNDPVAVTLRAKHVAVRVARDALFLAVHAFLQEAGASVSTTGDLPLAHPSILSNCFCCWTLGFRVDGGEADALPSEWEANSATGLFTAAYRHPNDLATKFALQVRCESLVMGGAVRALES